MAGVLTGFGIIAFVILVGYVAGRFGVGGPAAPYVLNRIAFFITNPALLFVTLAHADLTVVFSTQLLVAAIAAVGSAGLFLVLSRLFFRRPAAETTIGALGAGYVNANNIGLPVAVYVLGSASFVAPVLLLQLIVFAPIALTVLDVTSRGTVSVWSIVTQPVRNPMIIASVLERVQRPAVTVRKSRSRRPWLSCAALVIAVQSCILAGATYVFAF